MGVNLVTASTISPKHNVTAQKLSGRYVEWHGCPEQSTGRKFTPLMSQCSTGIQGQFWKAIAVKGFFFLLQHRRTWFFFFFFWFISSFFFQLCYNIFVPCNTDEQVSVDLSLYKRHHLGRMSLSMTLTRHRHLEDSDSYDTYFFFLHFFFKLKFSVLK